LFTGLLSGRFASYNAQYKATASTDHVQEQN